jgi:hypothetical protein
MSQNTDLKEIERKANLYHGDGLIDIVIGLGILIFAIAMILDQVAFTGAWIVLLLPALRSVKKGLTVPRLRYTDFRPAPNAQWKVKLVIVTVAGVVALLFTLGLVVFTRNETIPALTAWIREYGLFVVSVLLAGLLSLIAWATGAKRVYAYAAMAVITFFASGYWFNLEFALYLTVLGAIIVLSGMVVLVQFLRRYPILKDKRTG